MYRISFVLILLLVLFIVNLYTSKEHFDICARFDKCSKNTNSYSQCYDNSDQCTVMVDLIGNAFCTSKNTD
jgi:hypothetical protein